ncbi:MAG: cytochrome c-type biogenesis protein CcmH [Acidobacteria bacterium]|nr:cytochrome c-type biogenesis protein CcmH [Acidobacteriota bacterium]
MELIHRLLLVFVSVTAFAADAGAVADRLLAPCCWRESARVHQSPQAAQMRREIAQRLAAGENEEQIVAQYVAQYGARILRDPPGHQRWWLDLVPAAATLAGLAVLTRFIRRSLSVRNP